MVRKLALAVSIALGTVSAPALALGLGDLSSKSNLNQNFAGDIGLRSISASELDTVRVKLADADAFNRAGVERPFYLSLLKFQPTLTARGKPVIRVTSEFPIREPFLNFLIEVNWPKGRLMREYTVLLDPPTTTPRRPPKVTAAKTAPKPRAVAPPVVNRPKPKRVAKPVVAAPVPVQPTVSPGISEYLVKRNDTVWGIAKKLRPRGASMSQMMMALFNANPAAFVNNDINRLRRGRILRVPELDEIQQLSRLEAGKAYRQQQDQWLARKDPKVEQVVQEEAPKTAEPVKQAAQKTDAVAVTQTSGGAASNDKLRIATARPEGEGAAGAGDDDAVSPKTADLKSRLMVARENAETSRQQAATLRTQVDDLEDRLRNMQKLISLKDEQLARLQDQVAVNDKAAEAAASVETPAAEPAADPAADEVVIEDSGSVKDALDQLVADATAEAEAEAQAAAMSPVEATSMPGSDYRISDIAPQIDPDAVVAAGGITTPEPAMVDDGIAAQIDPDKILESLAAEAAGISDIPPQVDPDAIVEQAAALEAQGGENPTIEIETGDTELVIEDAIEAGVEVVDPVTTAMPAEPVEPVVATPAAQDQPLIPAELSATLEKNIVPIAAGGVGILALLGWLMMRGRREEDAPAAEAVMAGAATDVADAAPAAEVHDQSETDNESVADLPDSAFLDDFSPSEINSLQDETGEVDPVSEADVYIAYGRYQQAEELLRQAMERDPDRLALKHKLLEVHYATRNADSFAKVAQEMVDTGQDSADEVAWKRAQDMGREIAPNNALFAVGAAALAGAGLSAAEESELSIDDLDLTQLAEEYDADRDPTDDLEAVSEVNITLDLEEASQLQDLNTNAVLPDSEMAAEAGTDEELSLDDLESLEFELPESEAADSEASPTAGAGDITDSLDLDSMMADAEAAVDAEDSAINLDSEFSADELQAQLDELSDLSILDNKTDDEVPDNAAPGVGLISEDLVEPEPGTDTPISLDEAFDAADDETAELDLLDLEDGESSMPAGAEDDVETKLDLARAYVEMGDDEGARGILDEVVTEGNSSQKGEAQKLLSELG